MQATTLPSEKLPEGSKRVFISQMSHEDRKEYKRLKRERIYNMHSGPKYVAANLSVKHPDHGLSLQDHIIEKNSRHTEKSS